MMKRLKTARERYGLTQSELAERLGTTQQTIARWEAGKAEPNLAALRDLAICLNTSVDRLIGRKSAREDQTTDPVAWVSGDKSGYWGNIGIRLPHRRFSIWYPITTSTMEQVFGALHGMESNTWISFQTLNNKMIVCRPSQLQALTFLDQAEDQIEDDWNVGPDDVEGWPQEIYECLEHLLWEQLGGSDDDGEFSEKLVSGTRALISKYELDDKKLLEMCIQTRITHTDGTTRLLHVSPERLATVLFDLDLAMEDVDSTMLHLDDEGGEHSVFLSLDLISLIEFPLRALKKGMEEQSSEDALGEAAEVTADDRRHRPLSKTRKSGSKT